jgi:hypothetical protein
MKGSNGEKIPVNFSSNHMNVNFAAFDDKTTIENYEKPEGSNKTMLYCALILGVAVLAGSGYLIYKYHNNKTKKEPFDNAFF